MKKGFDFSALYRQLKRRHGRPGEQWRLWCKRPKEEHERQEVVIGAILTQNTNWKNVEYALRALKAAGCCSLARIAAIPQSKLERLVRPAGFYRQKSAALRELAGYILSRYGTCRRMADFNPKILRQELLALRGVGPETADSILLYAADHPVFVIDAYTRRFLGALGDRGYRAAYDILRARFESSLRRDYRLYQDYHALIVIEGKGGRVKEKRQNGQEMEREGAKKKIL